MCQPTNLGRKTLSLTLSQVKIDIDIDVAVSTPRAIPDTHDRRSAGAEAVSTLDERGLALCQRMVNMNTDVEMMDLGTSVVRIQLNTALGQHDLVVVDLVAVVVSMGSAFYQYHASSC